MGLGVLCLVNGQLGLFAGTPMVFPAQHCIKLLGNIYYCILHTHIRTLKYCVIPTLYHFGQHFGRLDHLHRE